MEEGTHESGWSHIKKKHITGEIKDGSLFPKSMSEKQVEDTIFDSIVKSDPTKTIDPKGRISYIYNYVDENGLKIKTIVGSNGYIVTSFPILK